MSNRTRKCLAIGSADFRKHGRGRIPKGSLMNFKISVGRIHVCYLHPPSFLSKRITNKGLQLQLWNFILYLKGFHAYKQRMKKQKMSIIRIMGLTFPLLSNFLSEKNLLKNWHILTSLILKSRIIIKDMMQFNFFDVHLHL